MTSHKKRIVVLISGSGSNLQAIIDACANNDIAGDICAVLSNRADAYGLVRATNAHIATQAISHKAFESREAYDAALQAAIDDYQPDLVVLAGFMRILTPAFTQHYQGRMLNIHPSLLPKYQGLHTHQRAIDAGDAEHGVSVHFVTEELDGGPVIQQAKVSIEAADNAESLAAKVLTEEHQLYPRVINWFCEERLIMRGQRAYLDAECLPSSGAAPDRR